MHTQGNPSVTFWMRKKCSHALPPTPVCPNSIYSSGSVDGYASVLNRSNGTVGRKPELQGIKRLAMNSSLDRLAVIGIALFLLILVPALVPSTAAQSSFPGTPDGPTADLRVYPGDFWGPRSGPGVGLGVVAHNITRPNDQWLLTAAPARYEQVGTASFASANPRRARRYVLIDTRALHTDRDWLGPPSGRTVLERTELRARARVGQSLLNRRLLLQPHVTVSHHYVDAVSQPESRSRVRSTPLPGSGTKQAGIRPGLDLQFDTRDRPVITTRGVLLQGTWDRYLPLDGSALQFDRVDLDGYGYIPFGDRHRLVTRLSMTITRSRGSDPVPVYMLPILGGSLVPGWSRGHFVDSDRLMASTLYRFPLIHLKNVAGIEGHLGVHVASVYDNVGEQFSTTVSFKDNTLRNEPTRPLRPSASAGLRFTVPFRKRATLDLSVGVTPEGVRAVRFSLVRSLQAVRFPHHSSDNVR